MKLLKTRSPTTKDDKVELKAGDFDKDSELGSSYKFDESVIKDERSSSDHEEQKQTIAEFKLRKKSAHD